MTRKINCIVGEGQPEKIIEVGWLDTRYIEVRSFEVVYTLTDKEGNKVVRLSERIFPKKLFPDKRFVHRGDGWDSRIAIIRIFEEKITSKAHSLLKEYRKQGKHIWGSSILYGGKHIVGCSWEIDHDEIKHGSL